MHTMKVYKGSRDINPLIRNLIIRQRSLVSLMLWPLYSHSNSPLYELNNRLGGSQNQSGCLREEKNFLPLPGNQTLTSSQCSHCTDFTDSQHTHYSFSCCNSKQYQITLYQQKLKQVNEIQPTKVAVVFKVKLSNLKEPSSRSKAAY